MGARVRADAPEHLVVAPALVCAPLARVLRAGPHAIRSAVSVERLEEALGVFFVLVCFLLALLGVSSKRSEQCEDWNKDG